MDKGELRRLDPERLAWCLMGMNDYTGMLYILWEDSNEAIADVILDRIRLGIAPEQGWR